MFNKKVNKILAINLALGLSFVSCNFRAVNTKPHGIAEWVKLNPVKSVLIGLLPLLGGVGCYLGCKSYQYFHIKFYDSKSEAEKNLEKIEPKYNKKNREICAVCSTSKDGVHQDNHEENSDEIKFFDHEDVADSGRYAKVIAVCASSRFTSTDLTIRYANVLDNGKIKTKDGKIFTHKKVVDGDYAEINSIAKKDHKLIYAQIFDKAAIKELVRNSVEKYLLDGYFALEE
ncbi:MAG: hypothetical protein RsTaC01_0081 [Candidatus Paraimprobicoccus trichonymphae]|uniref:Lipoprotein n=1 Tax=Candidatus Paraimprobicoccus trichonymphae TaxID=3033793 RepID=A0AA48KVX0_9FIRM|nr:MAG: hypothetical protein RsTaC01_0081 [Candidatus Paraimprobicoccus trichonymphae]